MLAPRAHHQPHRCRAMHRCSGPALHVRCHVHARTSVCSRTNALPAQGDEARNPHLATALSMMAMTQSKLQLVSCADQFGTQLCASALVVMGTPDAELEKPRLPSLSLLVALLKPSRPRHRHQRLQQATCLSYGWALADLPAGGTLRHQMGAVPACLLHAALTQCHASRACHAQGSAT